MMSEQKLVALLERPKFSPEQLRSMRGRVEAELLSRSKFVNQKSFKVISDSDLGLLFDLIDEIYFAGECRALINSTSASLDFRLSKRMTSCGGTTTLHYGEPGQRSGKKLFEIAVAATLIFETFRIRKSSSVGGLPCRDPLTALTRIMEHEMVHLVELLLWDSSSCSAKRFQQISWRTFGHLEPTHQLLTPRDIARETLGIRPGDTVTFTFDGVRLRGHVNRITRRATVLVPSKKGAIYDDGKRYAKYYVPLTSLRRE